VTHYQTLGVHAGSTDEQIKDAYRKLAREHHPDRGGDVALFTDLPIAYAAIKDIKARATYRAWLALHGYTCIKCGGSGYKQTTKSFISVVRVSCTQCGGCGYTL
jgi:DnaJ-class molecular chaperone